MLIRRLDIENSRGCLSSIHSDRWAENNIRVTCPMHSKVKYVDTTGGNDGDDDVGDDEGDDDDDDDDVGDDGDGEGDDDDE
nr:unnamed protein product [Spirometra erinaceieuropaei]